MNPRETTAGDSFVVKSQIDGTMEISISDWTPKKIGKSRVPLIYNGFVKSGTGSISVDAYIFSYKLVDNDKQIPEMLHKKCSAINHPNIMRSLGYGRGSKEYANYMFIAFPKFEKTMSDYCRPASGATELERFSTPFINIARDVVNGLEVLDENGFGCPNLKSTHIAIIEEGNSLTAKIWNFFKCDSAELKDNAWIELGRIFFDAMSNNYASHSVEIGYLYRRMIDSKLKGKAILKQSALLTVPEKFENILVLWRYVSLNCQKELGGQPACGQGLAQQLRQSEDGQGTSGAQPIWHTLEEYLDLEGTIAKRPSWIDQIRSGKPPKTFRELLDELRDIIEHEIEYIPPSEDLEYWFRKAWAKDFLKIQLWASDPGRKIKETQISLIPTKTNVVLMIGDNGHYSAVLGSDVYMCYRQITSIIICPPVNGSRLHVIGPTAITGHRGIFQT